MSLLNSLVWVSNVQDNIEYMSEEVGREVKNTGIIFQTLTSKVAGQTFKLMLKPIPTRYFGAKDWSMPGAAGRLAQGVVAYCRHKTPISKDKIFPNHPSYSHKIKQELTKDTLTPFLPHIFAARAVDCHNAEDWTVPLGYHSVMPSEAVISAESFELQMGRSADDEYFLFDPATRLKIAIFQKYDESGKTNKFIISFGSLGARYNETAERAGDVMTRALHATGNILGGETKLYKKADRFVEALLKTPAFEGAEVELAGLSLGGSLASYIGLKQGLPAVCLNSLTLGAGLQKKIGKDRLKDADKLITHIVVKGDRYFADQHPVSKFFDKAAGRCGFRTPGNFGKKLYMPNVNEQKGPSAAHKFPYYCAMSLMDYGYGEDHLPHSVDWKAGVKRPEVVEIIE